ncbi:hypothetical protein SPRG_05509 [Saprolegnia parasitica CBS 223.65]|uniref:SET domain-containing protein n=1 Tax=Saprolegnia parasitica (strain CBS 223.65) TaxID=695850 RepID=A0A067CGB4_SAPPC|nr:hypothetical protein SPRG_05509 [Saprolegnia parasitica CBS 223.65]KDO29553.1 hypothetical protein SPRG_05509 [Saprolegnia parasitica CBS 223.65]|eukprot:XP_012199618.1 hypothetical protein SPRG_05509 [Saprolegnia parasitica CBS 223.65]
MRPISTRTPPSNPAVPRHECSRAADPWCCQQQRCRRYIAFDAPPALDVCAAQLQRVYRLLARASAHWHWLFPVAAALNHACVPNCVATFRGRELHLRALRPISPGDELTIAYTEVVAPTRARRLELATSYFFHCDCLRCMGSGSCWAKKEPLLEGLGCSQSGCAGRLEPAIDGAVNTCPTCLTVTECNDVTPRLVQRAIQAADDAERRKDVPKAIASRQRAYALTQASYHKYHADNIAGAETLANLIMSAENARFRDAAQNSLALALYASALEGLRWLYGPELAPLRGLTTLKYAQALHLADPRAKDEALRLVQEACPLLATTHGDDSAVVATAIALLHELQRVE